MYKITVKKTVQETYIIERDEAGTPVDRNDALRLACVYAQLPEHEMRSHITAWHSRVGGSHKVLGIKDMEIERIILEEDEERNDHI